jgi:murein DD-endopeptidase MepM/ murein hydrolase activator NlpD
MRFPIEEGPAFANSQVWGNGGSQGPAGTGQCDEVNRSYPWHDNYCETRTWDMPLCPAGTGHQGQDIRAATCEKDVHWAVAVTDGTITSIGTYTVYLTAEDGTRFDYLHMGSVQVSVGQEVKRGEHLGKVSNEFGGTPTTTHLHFNIKQDVDGIGFIFVPPYLSLVTSYQRLMNTAAEGELHSATCERVRGASRDSDTPDEPNDVSVSISGTAKDPTEIGFVVTADRATDALCEEGSTPCPHGFDTKLPVSLLDGSHRKVSVRALDTWVADSDVELAGSPETVTCSAFQTAGRVRRRIDDESMKSWGFDPFFDEFPLSAEAAEALPEANEVPSSPQLVTRQSIAQPEDALWIVDGTRLRPVSEDALFMFGLDVANAEPWSDEQRGELSNGFSWPYRPVIVRGADGTGYLLDVDISPESVVPRAPQAESDPDADGGGGCACRAAALPVRNAGTVAVIALGLAALRLRRRSRGATSQRRVR